MAERKTSMKEMKRTMQYEKEHLKRIPLNVQKTYYEETLRPAADAAGMKMNEFIKAAIAEKIERMNLQ